MGRSFCIVGSEVNNVEARRSSRGHEHGSADGQGCVADIDFGAALAIASTAPPMAVAVVAH